MNILSIRKRLNGNDRLILVVFTGIVILVTYLIASTHYLNLVEARNMVLERLKAISNTARLQLNGDKHELLTSSYLQKDDISTASEDSIYYEIHRQLKEVHETNSLESPVYTMVYNGEIGNFQFVVTSSEEPYFRHTYSKFPTSLKDKYMEGGTQGVYETENGKWLSAFAPIKNSKGVVVGVLQVDEQFSQFTADARINLLQNVFIASILLIPLSVFLYSYMKNTLRKEEMYRTMLEEQNEEIQIQNELIKDNNNKLEHAKLIIEQRNESLDKQVQKRTEELLKSNLDLSTFLYRSSHDIMGPIATLKGLCKLAPNENLQMAPEYFRHVEKELFTLENRVKSINAVYEIKNTEIATETFDLLEVILSVKQKYEYEIESLKVQMNINIPDRFIISSDKKLISLITNELIKNSLQYRSIENQPSINLSADRIGSKFFRFTIEDNGPGIAEEQQEKVFQMFQRGNEVSQGSGLGLYSIKLALEKLHGKVELVTRPHAGARFQLIIPSI